MVLCVGHDGHVALEPVGDLHCTGSEAHEGHESSPTEQPVLEARGCHDIVLSSHVPPAKPELSSRGKRRVSAARPAPAVHAGTWASYTPPLPVVGAHTSARSFPLLSLRTIVLLV